jgi:ribosomal protein S18 acetylase RimI-like enzyme
MFEIRRYRQDDADAVWDLHNLALEGTGAHLGNGPWDKDLKRIKEVYLDRGGEFLVGVLDGRIVAMGGLNRTDEERGEIKRMRVHPDHQRRGLGTAILEHLESGARSFGYKTLHLETAVVQTAAQKLYEKHGYREVGRTVVGGLDTILYEKRID